MKKLRNDKYYGITTRMVVFFIVLVIMPYLCLAAITYIVFQNYSVSSMGKTTMDTVTVAGANIHKAMREREDDSMAVYYNDCVELLGKDKAFTELEKTEINHVLSAINYSNTGIVATYLEAEGEIFHSGGNYSDIISIMEPYKDEIIDAGGKCCWYATSQLYGKANEYNYILARSLNNSKKKNVGILYLISSDKMILDSLGELSTEYATWYLTDGDGRIFYSSDSSQRGKLLDISMLSERKKRNYQIVDNEMRQKNVIASYCLMDVRWFCVSVIDTEIVVENVRKLTFPFVLISMIYILFLFIMLYSMKKYVFEPLRVLKKSMDQYAQGELGKTGVEIYGIGEFQSLSKHFNNMTFRIDGLVEAYKRETEEKNRQKMKTLAAQLTPHFIYNALNTIKWVAVLNHQDKIQNLVESLINIFMNAARTDDDNYTLKDELELIQNYAVIQKTRFMNFDLLIEAEPSSLDCRIRKLLVQPIVENAIVHGLNRGRVRDGRIEIKVWMDEQLHITVTDKGIGFDVEKWRQNPKKDIEHTNIGIHNVEEMIQLEYGQEYGLTIESEKGKGTKIIYILPIIRKEKKDDSDDYC